MVQMRFFTGHSNADTAKLERIRQKLGLSRLRFAELLGMSHRNYERYVSIKNPAPPPPTVMLLAYHLEDSPQRHIEIVAKYRRSHTSK